MKMKPACELTYSHARTKTSLSQIYSLTKTQANAKDKKEKN
jgi:hypothetical protein